MSQPLGLNQGCYRGETIAIGGILNDIQAACLKQGWRADPLLAVEGFSLLAYHRAVARPRKRLYLSTGIHGDEPAGPLAMLRLLREDPWRDDVDVWLCPCLNPIGFDRNRRENLQGIDLNRDYRHLTTAEVRSHVNWLQRQPSFDCCVVLHEDWEARGFYLYELNPQQAPSLAESIIQAVSDVCPIEPGELVDGWPARQGIIRPNVAPRDRPQWAESIFLVENKTSLNYTLETPSDFPLGVRVAAHVAGVKKVLDLL